MYIDEEINLCKQSDITVKEHSFQESFEENMIHNYIECNNKNKTSESEEDEDEQDYLVENGNSLSEDDEHDYLFEDDEHYHLFEDEEEYDYLSEDEDDHYTFNKDNNEINFYDDNGEIHENFNNEENENQECQNHSRVILKAKFILHIRYEH